MLFQMLENLDKQTTNKQQATLKIKKVTKNCKNIQHHLNLMETNWNKAWMNLLNASYPQDFMIFAN
jgi:hypothetical protein